MKLRQLAVFLAGYLLTVGVLAHLYHSFAGTASVAIIATCLAIALLIGFGAGTSDAASAHATTFVAATFCGALTIVMSFYLGTVGTAIVALPYVFFWSNAVWLGMRTAGICRTALNTR
jgi:hypothetical protein